MTTTALTSAHQAEATLIAGARRGDEAAVRALVQANNRRLYRVTRAVLGDDAEAEDAVQESYMRAFAALDGFRAEAGFSTWLTRIALNEALARLRRRRPTVPLDHAHAATVVPFPGPQPPDPEAAAARRQVRDAIETAVDRLPRPFRVVFVLRDVEELTTAETADLLGLAEATVKTRLHRARRLLRRHIDAEIVAVLSGTFPFGGRRCAAMVERIARCLRRG